MARAERRARALVALVVVASSWRRVNVRVGDGAARDDLDLARRSVGRED